MRLGFGVVAYLCVFVLARGALFFCPLLLANLLPSADYGTLEWAYATGTVLASLATLGTTSVVPLMETQNAPPGASLAGIRLHHVVIALAAAIVAGLVAVAGLTSRTWPVAVMTASIVLQSLRSTEYKSAGMSNASLMTDAALFGAMAAFSGTYLWLGWWTPATGAWVAVGALAVAFGTGTSRRIGWHDVPAALRAWAPTIRAGLPLMLTGFVAIAVASSGRLGIGWLADPVTTATYAVLSRGAALPIVAHQLVLVARFRTVFHAEAGELRATLVTVLGFVAAGAGAFWALCPSLGWVLGAAFSTAARNHRIDLLWLSAQTILWSAIALNDLLNTRYGKAGAVLGWSLPALIALVSAGALVIVHIGASVGTFIRVHGLVMLLFYAVQVVAMMRNGLRFRVVWGFAAGAYVVLVAVALIADRFGA
jgi:hypothetical protein